MSRGMTVSRRPGAAEAWSLEELSRPRSVAQAAAPVDEAVPEAAAVEPAGAEATAELGAALDAAAEAASAADEDDAAARQMAEALEASYREGHAAGYAEGERSAAARLEAAVRLCEEAARAVKAGEAARLAAIENDLAALAVAAARQLVGKAVELEPEIVADVVRRAIAHFPGEQPLQIRVNPEDLQALTTGTAADGRPIAVGSGRDIRWIADPQIARGGCVVEGRDRIVDGRVDLALERAYRMLVDG